MVLNDAGHPIEWEQGPNIDHGVSYQLCRCGHSANKPFCDWAHASEGFDGTETADPSPTANRREAYQGNGIVLTDDKTLCVHAGFCVTEKIEVWDLINKTADPQARQEVIQMVRNCPAGRLEYQTPPDDTPVEDLLPKAIGVVADGPLFIRGKIAIEGANGDDYERRNRVTLCRCGASKNKPFCDGMHAEVGFRDED